MLPQALANAIEHRRAGRFQEAEVIYRQIVASEPDCAEGWRLLGMIAHEPKHQDAAVAYIERALQLQPGNAAGHNSLGIVQSARGEQAKAAASFRRAVELAPDNPEAHNNLGACLNAQGRAEKA